MEYRAKGIDLVEYLRENLKSMKVLERSLEAKLHPIWSEVAADTNDHTYIFSAKNSTAVGTDKIDITVHNTKHRILV